MKWNSIEAQHRDERGRVALTARQQAVVETIRTLTLERDYPPSIRELMEQLGMQSPNGVKAHLRLIRRKGWITWDEHKARTLRVVGK